MMLESITREGNSGVYALSNETGLVNKTYTAAEAEGKMVLSVSSGKAMSKVMKLSIKNLRV